MNDADEVAQVRDAVVRADPAALVDGSWLMPVVRDVLGRHAHTTIDAIAAAHGGLVGEALVDARIVRAQRRSLVAGGLSAATYASVVAGGVVSGGWLAAAVVPAAVASFAFDVFSTARIQLRLGWDLALLHGHPLDPYDHDQLLALARIRRGRWRRGSSRSRCASGTGPPPSSRWAASGASSFNGDSVVLRSRPWACRCRPA